MLTSEKDLIGRCTEEATMCIHSHATATAGHPFRAHRMVIYSEYVRALG